MFGFFLGGGEGDGRFFEKIKIKNPGPNFA